MWLTRYWRHPLKTVCADKYLVRNYVREQGLEHLLVELLWSGDKADDIPFDALPQSFVLKCNHGSSFNVICKDKSKLDIRKIKDKIDTWLKTDFSVMFYEIHYRDIPRKIICEKLLSEQAPVEYQFWCINGKPMSMLVCRKNFYGRYEAASYSIDGVRLNDRIHEDMNVKIDISEHLSEMVEYAKTLSKPFPFVRADFYEVNGRIYFAELTFTPDKNLLRSYKSSFHEEYGRLLVLPEKYI